MMRTCFRPSHFATAALILTATLAVPALADVGKGEQPLLPRDDKNTYGRFDNGLSYILRPHAKPPGRVWMYLHIQSGALNESDAQNGLAHFLEHMAFNGSTHFKPGELVPLLNKMGMQFGADTNAHTNHEETVYKLFLPDTKPETLDTGLTILADFANGALLKMEEIDNERKVILEESRARKSAMERLQKESVRKVFAGTHIAKHDVIGDEDQIKTFPREEFVDYYDTWYRPELMTLVVVGDVDPKDLLARAEPRLGEFAARKPKRDPRKTGIQPVKETRAFVLTDEEQVGGMVRFSAILAGRPPMRTFADYHTDTIENVGTWIVSRRLREMVDQGKAKFRMGRVSVSGIQHDTILPGAQAMGEPEDWNKMLDQLVGEVSRAIEHGFTPGELELARKEMMSDADRAVQIESTLDAGALVGRISSAIGKQAPLMSAAQERDLLVRVLPKLTIEEIHDKFVENFKTRNYTYVLMLPAKKEGLKVPTNEEVLAAAAAAWSRKTEPPAEKKSAVDLLAKRPEPGRVADTQRDEALGVTTLTFANGVVMHHRFMDYKKEQVSISILLPGGEIEETAANRGVSDAASVALRQPATSRLSSTEIRDTMTGRKVNFGGRIGLDALGLGVSGAPEDLELGMQLAYAVLTDGRVEPAALDNWKLITRQRLERQKTMPQGAMQKALQETVFGNDPRLVDLTPEQIDRQTPATAEAWIRRIVSAAPIEVTVVGDLPLEKATELVARYVGSLPKRTAGFSALDKLRKLDRPSGPYTRKVSFVSKTPKAIAMAGFISCEERDVEDRRRLSLASQVLSDRMIKRIREQEQLVYSIRCSNNAGRGLPGMGLMIAAAPTDPHNADKLADTIIEMCKTFAKDGPTDEELSAAKKQIITEVKTRMKEPRYWESVLSDMTYRGRQLSELRDVPAAFEAMTGEQIRDAVRKYLADDKVVRIVAVPEEGKGETGGKPAKEMGGKPAAEKAGAAKP